MLVLNVRIDQSVQILRGDEVLGTITLVDMRRGHARIGLRCAHEHDDILLLDKDDNPTEDSMKIVMRRRKLREEP